MNISDKGVRLENKNFTRHEVLELQLALREVGVFTGRVDAIIGPKTIKAWLDWKSKTSLSSREDELQVTRESWLLLALQTTKQSRYRLDSKQATINSIKQCAREFNLLLPEQQAYIIATVHHETDNTFKAIEEYSRGRGRAYGRPDLITKQVYYGRGYVQLTWKYNYEKYSKILNADLVNYPELALHPPFALFILIDGFKHGVFTGRKLETYINADTKDYINARRCINGLDDAGLIANLAKQYLKTEF